MLDVIIVGGGPAGLSAALVLGRCRRNVVVFDDDHPRNGRARAVHGFLTRDGIAPVDLRKIARAQLTPYGVQVRQESVVDASTRDGGFVVTTSRGEQIKSRKLLLATGVRDRLPELPGLEALLGTSVFQCPYCDGWEVRDRKLAALATPESATEFALGLLTWSRDVVLFAHGSPPSRADRGILERNGISIETERVISLRADGERLCAITLEGGREVPRDALFLHLGQVQRSPLVVKLGCVNTEQARVEALDRQSTEVPGLYVAGDAAHDVQFVAVAVAEGAKAANAINQALRRESLA